MTTDLVNAAAQSTIADYVKLYGPNGIVSTAAPPADMITVLEQLETASVDLAKLSGAQTVASVSTQTLNDLNSLDGNARGCMDFNTRPLPTAGQALLGILVGQLLSAAASLKQDATAYTPGTTPPVVVQDPPPAPANGAEQVLVQDVTTGNIDWENATLYSGPVAGVQNQFIAATADNLNITATQPNSFIKTGGGDDAIDVSHLYPATHSGSRNVLDGGAGSNFLVGGFNSQNTFFVDDRAATADIWSTIVNAHPSDDVTVWGITPGAFGLSWVDGQGAAGNTGLTLHATANGKPTASLTVAGYTSADLNNGHLAVSYGTTSDGNAYMQVNVVSLPGS